MIGSMTTPNDPNSGLPNYGGSNDNYGSYPYGNQADNQYGQNYGQAYGQGYEAAGYPSFDEQSESGRPLVIRNEPLPVAEAMSFGFKRLFTKNWHVYVGITFLMSLIMGAASMIYFVPMINEIMNNPELIEDPTYNPVLNNPGGYAGFALISSVAGLILSLVLYNRALRDTRGEKPSWKNLFKDVPWGQGILVTVLLVLAIFAVSLVFGLLIGLLASVNPVLGAVAYFALIILLFLASPLLAMIPLYAYDRRTNATGAFKAAWQDVKPQYGRVLGALILVGIVTILIIVFTLGFGFIIAQPFQILAITFIYRWISAYRDAPQQAPQHPEAPGGYMSMY